MPTKIVFADTYPRVDTRLAEYDTALSHMRDSFAQMPEIEDFAHVDDRRHALGMTTFAENKARLDQICNDLPAAPHD